MDIMAVDLIIPTAHSPAIDTVADSIFYVATDGGAYISDYISTYSYGSPYTDYIGHANIVYPVGSVDYLGRISSSYG